MEEQKISPYLVFFFLSLLSLGIIFWQATLSPVSDTRQILEYADNLVCLVFFVDFLISIHQADNKKQYFLRYG